MKKILVLAALLITHIVHADNNIENGKTIFKNRCSACHKVGVELVGPALKDVDKRRSEDWIIKFVHSSQTMIKNGDPQAVGVFNEMNQATMPDHEDLKDADIKDIISYIKDESVKIVDLAITTPFSRPFEVKGTARPITFNFWMFLSLAVVLSVLVYGFFVIINASSIIRSNK